MEDWRGMGDWHGGVLIGFDLETTGTEPGESRIVTAAVVEVRGGVVRERRGWLADPGIPIPEGASAIHGISTERAVAEGRPVREVADEVARALVGHWRAGAVVVAYNAAFYPRTPVTSQVSHDGEARRRPAAHAGMVAA